MSLELTPSFLQIWPRVSPNAVHDPLIAKEADVLQSDCARNRMPGVCVAVMEFATLLDQSVGDAVADHDAAERLVPGSDPFRHGHQVRPDAEALTAEPMAETAKAADDF